MFAVSEVFGFAHDLALFSIAGFFGAGATYVFVRYLQGATSIRDLRLDAARNEERFRLLVQGVHDTAIYMLDADGCVSNWNPGAERAKGYKEGEIVGQHFSCFYTRADREIGLPRKNLAIATETGHFGGEGWRVCKDGSLIWAQVDIEPLRNASGELIGFSKITRDRTEKMLAEREHRETAEKLQLTLSHMASGICLFDEKGRITLHNDRLREILGIGDRSLKGLTAADLSTFNPENAQEHLEEFDLLRETGGGEMKAELANGKVLRVIIMPTSTEAWVMNVEDVTEKAISERRIAHMARHDPLTGLPNRRQFIEALDASILEAKVVGTNVAVVNIDLNRFKEINDTYGHAAGDVVLSTLAGRFKTLVDKSETIGRFGGDEFMAMKVYRDTDDLDDFLRRLNEALITSIAIGTTEVASSASLGVAIFPIDANDRERLISNADMAMYRAKDDPIETICFYEAAMDEQRRYRNELARDIWTALKTDQFYLHYQVQKSACTLDAVGYEVLIRWNHPCFGAISPAEFIPIAEECGAIGAIGEWVLERACHAAAARSEGRIAVNLSPVQLTNFKLPERIREILVQTGLSPERLELEVTETAIISDKQRALHVLRQIKAMGVTIAIDDFGTGYSSLETLRSFPFDKIKLDRSFVLDLDTSIQARAFVRAMLALGKSLQIPVLAEGVETESQLRVLTEEGCDQFQGYLLGRPAMLQAITRDAEWFFAASA